MEVAIADQRIRSHVRETPLRHSRRLSASTGANVFLKLENLQETGSFKLRGAANKLLLMSREQAARGIIAASNGNHALAVATIGRKLGMPVEVFVSEHVDPVRRIRIESLQAVVQTVKGDSLLAEQTARRMAGQSERTYVSPYNDRDVIAGQGTIAVEFLRQLSQSGSSGPDAVFVAVGGGGLIGGIGSHLKSVSAVTEIVGCWPENSPVLYECLRAGEIIDVPEKPTLSVSTTGGMEAETVTLAIAQKVIDRKILVTEAEIIDAARRIYREDRQLIEGAAAVAVAGFLKTADGYAGKTIVIIVCGGNADPALEARIKKT